MLDDDEESLVVVDGSVRRKGELHRDFQLGRDDTSVLRELETTALIRYKLEVEIRIGVVLEKYRSITSSTNLDRPKVNRGRNTEPLREGVLLLVDLHYWSYGRTSE